jgi:hypothetical protein
LTSHSPVSRIFCFGELNPSQRADGLHSSHNESVEITLDSRLRTLAVVIHTKDHKTEVALKVLRNLGFNGLMFRNVRFSPNSCRTACTVAFPFRQERIIRFAQERPADVLSEDTSVHEPDLIEAGLKEA